MGALKTSYRAVTRQIEVKALPRFMPDRSSPENGYFFWAYTITLTNLGGETVQLKTRHWRITDGQRPPSRRCSATRMSLSRSGNGVRNGFRRPDGRGSGQFAESALDTLYVARNRG